jgi:hypothetical protein
VDSDYLFGRSSTVWLAGPPCEAILFNPQYDD